MKENGARAAALSRRVERLEGVLSSLLVALVARDFFGQEDFGRAIRELRAEEPAGPVGERSHSHGAGPAEEVGHAHPGRG